MKSDEVLNKLEALIQLVDLDRDRKTLTEAIKTIKRLEDEKESLWSILDEMKKSDIKNYKRQIEGAVAEKLLASLALRRNDSNEPN